MQVFFPFLKSVLQAPIKLYLKYHYTFDFPNKNKRKQDLTKTRLIKNMGSIATDKRFIKMELEACFSLILPLCVLTAKICPTLHEVLNKGTSHCTAGRHSVINLSTELILCSTDI